ncbi:MAG: hypothetical protein JXA89_18040, partial [Anaerolineae bacterium]|nr:hypothetical protein [Anaerolineae bacterium]
NRQFQTQSLSLLSQPELSNQDLCRDRAIVLLRLGNVEFRVDRRRAEALLNQSLELYQDLDDRWAVSLKDAVLGQKVSRFTGTWALSMGAIHRSWCGTGMRFTWVNTNRSTPRPQNASVRLNVWEERAGAPEMRALSSPVRRWR